MTGPDPSDKHPMKGFLQVCFIKNTVARLREASSSS
jgi:virginiamycin A acetyltransferase